MEKIKNVKDSKKGLRQRAIALILTGLVALPVLGNAEGEKPIVGNQYDHPESVCEDEYGYGHLGAFQYSDRNNEIVSYAKAPIVGNQYDHPELVCEDEFGHGHLGAFQYSDRNNEIVPYAKAPIVGNQYDHPELVHEDEFGHGHLNPNYYISRKLVLSKNN